MFPRLYTTEECPIPGYEGFTFRVLLNPTGQEKTDWAFGHLGLENCPECAKLQEAGAPKRYCAACAAARAQLGRAAVAVYGTSQVAGLDFSTPEASLASFGMDDLPDELLAWLYLLPAALWATRSDDLKKRLPGSKAKETSSPSST